MPDLFLKYPGYKKDFVYGSVNMQSDEGILKDSLSGKHGKQKKRSAESIATVVEHIKSFPKVDSHYCRKECSKGFLDQSLSIKGMHRLYIEHCKIKESWRLFPLTNTIAFLQKSSTCLSFAPKKTGVTSASRLRILSTQMRPQK